MTPSVQRSYRIVAERGAAQTSGSFLASVVGVARSPLKFCEKVRQRGPESFRYPICGLYGDVPLAPLDGAYVPCPRELDQR
jgi:hypothetical protein